MKTRVEIHATVLLFFAGLVGGVSTPQCHAVTIDWVTVGDPGNAGQTLSYNGTNRTFGAVAASFRIMKYEFTNQQYVAFLNAVDPDGTNPNSIYDVAMGISGSGGISFTSGATAGSKYASKTNMVDKPVNCVTWWDAARVANWLQAGSLTYGTTASGSAAINVGAYTLSGSTSGNTPAKNVEAQYWIPTENEWYKAAYYKGSGTNAGYWQYATQATGTAPIGVGATGVGTGTFGGVSPVITGNFANYNQSANWNSLNNGNVTTVGTNGGPSAYGAFDMSGNLAEWNDLDGTAGPSRGVRGGAFNHLSFNAWDLSSSARSSTTEPWLAAATIGFRLAGSVSGLSGVPEIDGAGARLALVLLACGLALLEQRRPGR